MITIACPQCGDEIQVTPSRLANASDGGPFCSHRCAALYRRANNSGPEPEPVPGSRWIQLTRGYWALVDDSDFDRLSQFTWSVWTGPNNTYAVRTLPSRATEKLHHAVTGWPSLVRIDHINGNGLDNRKSNLRLASHSENMRNKRAASKFGFKGVVATGRIKSPYRAQINIPMPDGSRKLIKSQACQTIEDAAVAYDKLAIEHFGEFAGLNFPDKTKAP